MEFEDSSSVQLAIRKASIRHGNSSDAPQDLILGGRQLRVQAWKSIKKAKETNKLRHSKKPESRQVQKSIGGNSSSIRIPTNLRTIAERKKFVKRALQKRTKRKQTEAAAGGSDRITKKKNALMGSKKKNIKKPPTKK